MCPAQSIFSLAVLVAFHAMLSSILFHQSPCVTPAPQQPARPLTIYAVFSISLPCCSPNRFPNQHQEKEEEGRGGGGGRGGRGGGAHPHRPLTLCRAGTVLGASHALTHLILTVTTGERYYYHPHFVNEEIEAQGC